MPAFATSTASGSRLPAQPLHSTGEPPAEGWSPHPATNWNHCIQLIASPLPAAHACTCAAQPPLRYPLHAPLPHTAPPHRSPTPLHHTPPPHPSPTPLPHTATPPPPRHTPTAPQVCTKVCANDAPVDPTTLACPGGEDPTCPKLCRFEIAGTDFCAYDQAAAAAPCPTPMSLLPASNPLTCLAQCPAGSLQSAATSSGQVLFYCADVAYSPDTVPLLQPCYSSIIGLKHALQPVGIQGACRWAAWLAGCLGATVQGSLA